MPVTGKHVVSVCWPGLQISANKKIKLVSDSQGKAKYSISTRFHKGAEPIAKIEYFRTTIFLVNFPFNVPVRPSLIPELHLPIL
jgi:hypothetical protein